MMNSILLFITKMHRDLLKDIKLYFAPRVLQNTSYFAERNFSPSTAATMSPTAVSKDKRAWCITLGTRIRPVVLPGKISFPLSVFLREQCRASSLDCRNHPYNLMHCFQYATYFYKVTPQHIFCVNVSREPIGARVLDGSKNHAK